jgi:hypothetical protein
MRTRTAQDWNEMQAWKQKVNPRGATYFGDTLEEFEALMTLANMGVLWAQQCNGPCGGGAICVAIPNPYDGFHPIIADPQSENTMGCDMDDTGLICAEHNRAMVKLYLTLSKGGEKK